MRYPESRAHSRRLCVFVSFVSMLASAGCGYTVRPPFDPNIRTVYVGMFKAQTFRRDQNIDLTNMIQQEIRQRTPYKVVGSPEGADARLEGTITFVDKNVQVESPNNLPRHLLTNMTATVTFTDNRTGQSSTKVMPPVVVGEMAPFYPEIGETASLGFQKTMQKMAKDIVSMMENPWGPEYRDDTDNPYDPETTPIDAPRGRARRRAVQPVNP